MTFEEYEKQDESLRQQRVSLRERFLDENKPCEKGSLVAVTTSGGIIKGVVTGFQISWQQVQPIVKRLKKDGTPSKENLVIFSSYVIKYLNQQTEK